MTANPLVQDACALLRAAGFADVTLIKELYSEESFGNAVAVFRVGCLIVRFLRDRSEDFVDLASTAFPEKFHQFDDVEIAMGWKSVGDVLARRKPEDPAAVITRLSQRFGELEEAFSREQEHLTRARIERAAKARGDAFVACLRRHHP